ncbi:response regulator [Candidatus Oscillochloris fontis]|uniref:response regulator n=1 Tax=Candidatus Oscillochloris fontis TaxID=2496868 RepID=UPI001930FF34|nr:response regulator [Candidatus Oscillochloris fontis]
MTDEVIILIAEDDAGHATLIQKNLRRAGLRNQIIHFLNGQEILDFLFRTGNGPQRDAGRSYLLVLDIRMPKVDGVEVLRRIKADPDLRKLPVTMLTTTEDPNEIERCHMLGCSNYVTKPVDYNKFIEAIRQLGLFFTIVQVPSIS